MKVNGDWQDSRDWQEVTGSESSMLEVSHLYLYLYLYLYLMIESSMLEVSHPRIPPHVPDLATPAGLPDQEEGVGESHSCDGHRVPVPQIPRPERGQMCAVLLLVQRIAVETPDMNHPPGLPHTGHKLVVKGRQPQEPLGREI